SGSKLGCETTLSALPHDATQAQLAALIEAANADPLISGIMLQKPLPRSFDEPFINSLISPDKDLDAIHPLNLGHIMAESDGFLPCTPAAVLFLMKYYGIDPSQGNTVILGRSNVVGKPLANMLLWKKPFANATVTICHSRTPELRRITQNADILIAAIGKPNFINAEMIKENSILIDVGINEVKSPEGKSSFVGDIDYNSCFSKVLAITPVPGGIGRITTSMLYLNLVKASLRSQGINKFIDEYIDLIFSGKQNE
ncbi:MAG: bifunctional 5,10-methylenetetrahydrofolate dehydrogenase/5,10-methenyltetrahydrofolate cyclohydrolase, partial [Candidatus Cloacimonetes bacterium]|nr:bifunctional 5,10-methylenetetrahydrofolate dehydrogenase/5,10-methenyltetrahydrofolate cyclohydrolase [Candidatus Cloacimonadota bacterium]